MSRHKRKLPSGKTQYIVRWREGDRNRSRAFDDPKVAKDFDKEITRIRQSGELAAELERRRVTVEDLATDWWERRSGSISPSARAMYGRQLDKRVLPEFGSRRVSQITVADVERWIADLREDEDGEPTILKACTVLQSLMTMAVRDGIIASNPVKFARKPAQGRTRVPYLIKPAAVEVMRAWMLDHRSDRDVMLLELLAYAGLRPLSEAVVLRWGQVQDRSVVIRDTKRKRERSVTLVEPLKVALTDWRRNHRNGADRLVIAARDGDEWTEDEWRYWRRNVFRPAAVASGLPADVRPRDLRGSFASLLVHSGHNIVDVAAQLGHSPTICLRDYARVFAEHDPANVKPAAQVIAEARFAARVAGMRGWAQTVETAA